MTRRLAVVGGGILGLAVARRATQVWPDAEVVVLEREDGLGRHQTGHNSGVIHAGLYYRPGSLKATLCRRGATAMLAYAEERDLPVRRCGKLVIATDESELAGLHAIHERSLANGVPGVRLLDRAGLRAIEPAADGLAAVHSPSSAVIDYRRVTEALADDLRMTGGRVLPGRTVTRLRTVSDGVEVQSADGALRVDAAIACAGLQSDRLAAASGEDPYPVIVPFSGDYYLLAPAQQDRVRGLIYPVPDPRVPFLGVHLTTRLDGSVLVGPNALPATARHGYRRRDVSVRDLVDVARSAAFWRFSRHYLGIGVAEAVNTLSRRRYARAAARYVPGIGPHDLTPGPRGVRAQALARDGTLVDDFVITGSRRILHVRNAPSPAATSSLAIAEHVVGRLQERLRD